MALLDYMSFDDVRAVLGVEDDEIRDTTLSLDLYLQHLELELEEVSPSLASDYATVAGISANERTDVQKRLYRATRLFATAAVAKLACSALPMTAPKEVTDEKNTVARFAQDPWRETKKSVAELYGRYATKLQEVYDEFKSTTTTVSVLPTLMLTAGLPVDPVTGE